MLRSDDLPFEGIVLARLGLDQFEIPKGCIVYGDGDGEEWIVWAPQIAESMRHDCPICRGEVA